MVLKCMQMMTILWDILYTYNMGKKWQIHTREDMVLEYAKDTKMLRDTYGIRHESKICEGDDNGLRCDQKMRIIWAVLAFFNVVCRG